MKESAKSPERLRLYNADLNKATREAIQQALLYLMSKMDYQKIKVTDIVKKAGISRSTFYFRRYGNSSMPSIVQKMPWKSTGETGGRCMWIFLQN